MKLLELDAASALPHSAMSQRSGPRPDSPRREARRDGDQPAERRQRPLLDADVDAEALRRVLLALGVA